MERLTDKKTAANLKKNYEDLRAAGMPRDIGTERYIKLAEYEDIEEFINLCDKPYVKCHGVVLRAYRKSKEGD